MAVTDFASAAAAVTGGYKQTDTDRGAAYGNFRFLTRFEKPVTGAATTESGRLFSAEGYDGAAQATATANALAALNAQRRHAYAGSPGRASGSTESPSGRGGVHTVDVT